MWNPPLQSFTEAVRTGLHIRQLDGLRDSLVTLVLPFTVWNTKPLLQYGDVLTVPLWSSGRRCCDSRSSRLKQLLMPLLSSVDSDLNRRGFIVPTCVNYSARQPRTKTRQMFMGFGFGRHGPTRPCRVLIRCATDNPCWKVKILCFFPRMQEDDSWPKLLRRDRKRYAINYRVCLLTRLLLTAQRGACWEM